MTRFYWYLLLITLLYGFTSGENRKQPTFAFTELEPSGIDQYDAKVYSQIIRYSIANLNIYSTLEFSDVSIRLAEQDMENSCKTTRCAIIAGQLLGVDFFGYGTIGKIGKTYTVSMQIVDVHTGKIVRNVSEFYKGKKKKFKREVLSLFAYQVCGIEPEKKK